MVFSTEAFLKYTGSQVRLQRAHGHIKQFFLSIKIIGGNGKNSFRTAATQNW